MPIPLLPAVFAAGKKFLGSKTAEWLIPGALSAGGALRQQSTSRQIAREQMAFQERMASTQAQRSAADFEAAGFNPALAYGHQAASPSGASATAENILGAGVSSAQSARMVQKQLQLLDQQILEQSNRAAISGSQRIEATAVGRAWSSEDVQSAFSDYLKQKLKADFSEQLDRQRSAQFRADMDPTERRILEARATMDELGIPALRNEAAIAEYLGAGGTAGAKVLGAGARIAEMFLRRRVPVFNKGVKERFIDVPYSTQRRVP